MNPLISTCLIDYFRFKKQFLALELCLSHIYTQASHTYNPYPYGSVLDNTRIKNRLKEDVFNKAQCLTLYFYVNLHFSLCVCIGFGWKWEMGKQIIA